MNLKKIIIQASSGTPRSKILIIYTGGTFGMTYGHDGVLVPFDFSLILEQLPVLKSLALELTVFSFEKPIDSSNINPDYWQIIGKIIEEHYNTQDGFVVL